MNAQRLRQLRKQQGMHQKELAQLLGISPSTIGMYEQGRREPDHATLKRLAELFDVSAGYLLGTEDIEDPIDGDALTSELLRTLMEQNALMFRAENFTQEDYAQLEAAIKLAVDITIERKKKKRE